MRLRVAAWLACAAFLVAAAYAYLHRPEPLELPEEALAPSVIPPSAPNEAGRRPPSDRRAPGGPLAAPDAPAGVTNEAIHDFLEKEKKKMGIAEILPPKLEAVSAPEPRPMSEKEAKAYLRRMRGQLMQQQRQVAPESGSVPLGDASTPALLGTPERSVPCSSGSAACSSPAQQPGP